MKTRIANLFMATAVFLSISASLSSCGPKDADIEKAVTEKINASPELSGISASVKDGVVTLSGEAKDDASKTMAENSVKEVKGVKSVVNNVAVAPPPAVTAPTYGKGAVVGAAWNLTTGNIFFTLNGKKINEVFVSTILLLDLDCNI